MNYSLKNLEFHINGNKYNTLRDTDKFLNYCIPYFERNYFSSFCKKTTDASDDEFDYVDLTLSVRIERKEIKAVPYKRFENLFKKILKMEKTIMSDITK